MANKRIQGITIELDGNTQPLENALKSLNKDINTVEGDLKKVNDALKLNPGDTEQVARKLELLAEKAELSQKKVDALKAAQAKMDADGVDKSSKAYQDLRTELSKAESKLRDISTEMTRTKNSAGEVAEGQKLLSNYLEATGQDAESLVSIVGTKLVDAYKSSSLGAAGYQKILEGIARSSTGSKDNVEALKKVLSSVDSGVSLESVVDQITLLGTKSDGAKKDVSNLAKEFVDLESEISGLDTEIKAVDDALKFDSSSVDKLTDKQALLTKAVSASEAQLKTLKAEYNKISPGDIGEEKFKALESEIARTQNQLTKYKTELANTNRSLMDMDSGLGKLSSSLSRVNAALKLDPANIDLLKQKEDLLTQAVVETTNKLNALKTEMASVDTSSDLGATRFNELKASIEQTQNQLTGYKTELNAVSAESSAFATNQQRLQTFFDATRTSVDQYANVLGSELVSALNSGKANANQLETALNQIGVACTGSRSNLDQFKAALDSVNSGSSLESVRSDIAKIGTESTSVKGEIGELGNELSSLNGKADLSNALEGMENLTEMADSVSEKLKGIGEAGLESSSQFQDANTQIQVGLGVTGEEADKLRQHAENIFSQGYAESVEDATAKLVEVKQVLGDVNDADLENLVNSFSTLEVAGLDYNESLRAVDNMMKSFGISSEEAMDLLVTGTQNGLNKSYELADNIAEYAPRWGEARVSASEYFSMLEAGSKNGAYNLDKVGDFLNEFLTSLSDGRMEDNLGLFSSKTQEVVDLYNHDLASGKDVLDAVIGDISNMTTETEKASAASTLWSSLGEDNALGMIESLGGVEDKYDDIGGAIDTATDANSNSVTTMQNTWETLKNDALAPVGEALAGVATTILQTLSPAIKGLSDWFTNLPGPIQTFIAVAGALVVGLAAIAPVVLAVVGAFAAIGPAITAAGGVMSAIAAAMSGPVVLAIAGVVAAIAGLIAVITNWDSICQWFQGMWDSFCTNFSDGWNRMCSGLGDWWNTTWTNITGFFSGVGSTIQESWSTFCNFFSEAWNNIWNGIQTGWENTKNWFSTAFTGISDTVHGVWDSFCTNVQNVWNNVWSGIQNGWENTKNWFNTAFENVKSSVTNIWNNLSSGVTNTWNTLTSTVQDTWNSCKEKVVNIANEWKENFQKTFDEVKNKLSEIWNNIKSTAENTWNNIKSTVSGVVDNMKNGIQNGFNWAKEKVEGAWNSIKNTTSQVWENIKNVVRGAIDKLKSFFNFNWELPKIKLPHFRISGSFSLNPPQIPTFSVDWYEKGGILTTPTIFGAQGSTLLGGGEAGPEAVLPIDNLRTYIREEINDALTDRLDRMIDLLEKGQNTQIVMETGQVVGALVNPLDEALGRKKVLSGRR